MSGHAPNEPVAAGAPAAHGHADSVFSDADLAGFRAEDFSAGKAVVLLMLSIFCTGVVIYSIVAYWVIFFSHA